MSIQTYNQFIDVDNRMMSYDSSTGVVTPESAPADLGIAMEFQANIKVLVGRDKYMVRPTTYTVVGSNADLEKTANGYNLSGEPLTDVNAYLGKCMLGAFEAGSIIASNIAKLSKGVLVGFFAKLGKYRQDEMPVNVPSGDNSWAGITLNNNEASEYGSDECERNEKVPYEKVSTYIRIPWLSDTASRQDVKDTFQDWEYLDNDTGMRYGLGQVKFKNPNEQIELIGANTPNYSGIRVGEHSRNLGPIFNNNDVRIGMSDQVVSEKFNSVVDGSDDEIVNP